MRLQAVSELEKVEEKIKSIPWGHNQRIMYKCKDVQEALFYVSKTIENGWSRIVLEHQIDGDIKDLEVQLPILIVDYRKYNQVLRNKQLKIHIILIF
nr:DUF1016 N-terminal domain-containing protein [Streptobacillus canis]